MQRSHLLHLLHLPHLPHLPRPPKNEPRAPPSFFWKGGCCSVPLRHFLFFWSVYSDFYHRLLFLGPVVANGRNEGQLLMGNIHVLLCANVAEEIEIGAHPWIASPVQDLWNETRPLCARKRHSVSYRDKTSGACFLFVCHQNLGLPFDGRTGGENDRVGDGSEKVASASCAPPNASVSQGNDIGSNICLAPPSVCPGVLRTIFPQATSFVPWDSPPVLESPFLVFGDAVPDPSFVWTPARPSGPVA
mmetsp:Transcript_40488/g.104973  ORF Transcript_40488/g.104973 Transcript_40488/m.104973 type:complete len:246 (+) Transcript_40488:263-1000(+)